MQQLCKEERRGGDGVGREKRGRPREKEEWFVCCRLKKEKKI